MRFLKRKKGLGWDSVAVLMRMMGCTGMYWAALDYTGPY